MRICNDCKGYYDSCSCKDSSGFTEKEEAKTLYPIYDSNSTTNYNITNGKAIPKRKAEIVIQVDEPEKQNDFEHDWLDEEDEEF